MIPPAAIRRPVTVITWVALSVACLVASPLLLAVGTLASMLLRRPQPRILASLVVAYFAYELAVLVACGTLWWASGFGFALRRPRFAGLHHRLLAWFVRGLAARVQALLDIHVVAHPSPEAAAALAGDQPLLFFSRHAGPADSVLLVDLLTNRYGRRPSLVFKEILELDPCVDLLAHRLPHAALDASEPHDAEAQIERVTAQLGSRGVLVLFPEGGNFTPERRRRALARLRRQGRRREAAAAQQMAHMMAPHPTGALAALQANLTADVVFSAHTGLGLEAFPRQMWRHPPIGKTLTTRMWLAPADQRPRDPDQQVRWLYEWWQRLDRWVQDEGEEG